MTSQGAIAKAPVTRPATRLCRDGALEGVTNSIGFLRRKCPGCFFEWVTQLN